MKGHHRPCTRCFVHIELKGGRCTVKRTPFHSHSLGQDTAEQAPARPRLSTPTQGHRAERRVPCHHSGRKLHCYIRCASGFFIQTSVDIGALYIFLGVWRGVLFQAIRFCPVLVGSVVAGGELSALDTRLAGQRCLLVCSYLV